MVRAAVDGIVNFREMDRFDPRWRLRLDILLSEIAERDRREFMRELHAKFLAYISAGWLSGDGRRQMIQLELDLMQQYADVIFDQNTDQKATVRDLATAGRDAWAESFGDPNDPTVQQAIDQVVASLQRPERHASGGVTDGDLIRQRLRHAS